MSGAGPTATIAPVRLREPCSAAGAGYGPALALTVVGTAGAFLAVMSATLLLVHPAAAPVAQFAGLINQQNQDAKVALFLVAFVVILPLALVFGPRLADALAGAAGPEAAAGITAVLAGSLAALLVLVRVSRPMPWGDGLPAVLGASVLWLAGAAALLALVVRGGGRELVARIARLRMPLVTLAGALVVAVLVCLTSSASLSAPRLLAGAALAAALLLAFARLRLRLPGAGRWPGRVIDVVAIVLLLLAIPDLVIFHARAGGGIPNIYFEPGIIQFQQDYILGPANQLLGGGALLVNVPVSQYGVGLIYFLYAWFHVAPIGYGTFGLLDGVLTALFYVAGYCVLRLAGTRRLLALAALLVAVLALVYNLQYAVGALPEEGPLRFGLPMVLVLAAVARARWPRAAPAARIGALCGLAVAAIWALEAFAYTAFTFAAIAVAEAWLRPPGERRRWLVRQALLGLLACVLAHLILALATLAAVGRLPDWGQYLAFVHAVVLGGGAGSISYGFADWSPGLAVGAGALASAAAIILLVHRSPGLARSRPALVIGLVAATAYEIAILSYTDNRSSTYLFPYVALPLLLAGTLWLELALSARGETKPAARRGIAAFALAVAVLLVTAAWPQVGGRFERTALAHAYPGGGLRAALRRLWHPPAIDPRAPEGQRLLARYIPGRRALILLPAAPDLGTEILIRSRRANAMFIGDPKADSLVPSVWTGKLARQVDALRPGDRLLVDRTALSVAAALRANQAIDPLKHPIDGGWAEEEWLLRAIARRFELRALYAERDGLIVAELSVRRS